MVNVISFFIVIFANVIGAFSGMGGGIIIKPLVSILCHLPLASVLFYSNLSVLVMCITSFIYSRKTKATHYESSTVIPMMIGSFIGGIVGTGILSFMMSAMKHIVQPVQIIITIITIVVALIYQWRGHALSHPFQTPMKIACVGFIMGFFSVILGIGGGPINVWLLMMFLALPLKKATSYSLLSVLTAVSIRILSDLFHLSALNLSIVTIIVFMMSALLGALMGIFIKRHLSTKNFKVLYSITLVGVIIINVVNLFI